MVEYVRLKVMEGSSLVKTADCSETDREDGSSGTGAEGGVKGLNLPERRWLGNWRGTWLAGESRWRVAEDCGLLDTETEFTAARRSGSADSCDEWPNPAAASSLSTVSERVAMT